MKFGYSATRLKSCGFTTALPNFLMLDKNCRNNEDYFIYCDM